MPSYSPFKTLVSLGCLFLGLILLSKAHARTIIPVFNFTCLNIITPGSLNTRIILNMENQQTDELKCIILFRQHNRNLYSSEKFLKTQQNQSLYSFDFSITPGTYEIYVELVQENTGLPYILKKMFHCRDMQQKEVVSDIVVYKPGTQTPWLSEDIPSDIGQISFSADIICRENGFYTIRAVLYHQDENPYSDAAGKFSSVLQHNKLLQFKGSPQTFEATFDLDENTSGNYLIEIFVYKEDNIVAEANYPFYLVWKQVPEMLNNPRPFLPFLKWLNTSLAEFADTLDDKILKERFLNFWVLQMDENEGYRYAAMEDYYRKVSEIQVLLNNDHAWNTDAGKYALLLGMPDSIYKSEIKGDSIFTWYYNQPRITCYFIKPKGETLMESLSLRDKIRLYFLPA